MSIPWSKLFSRQVLLLTFSVAIVGSNSLILSPIASEIAASFGGIAASQVMYAASAFGLGVALSAFFLSPLVDRVGAERALSAALGLMVLAMAGSALSQSLLMLVGFQALVGVAAGLALPSCYALGAQVAPKGAEARTLGIILFGWTISMVAGVSFSALLADLSNWRVVFALLGLLAAGLLPLILLTQEWGERPPRDADQKSSPIAGFKVPGIGRGLMIVVAFMGAFYGLYAFAGSHVTDTLGLSTTMAALVPLAYGIGFGLAVPLDDLIDRLGQDRVALGLFPILAMTYIAVGLASNQFWVFILLCLIWGLFNHVGVNLVVGRLIALSPKKRGAILGIYSTTTYLAMMSASAGFKLIFDVWGLLWCSLFAAGLILIAAGDAVLRAIAPAARPNEDS